MLQFLKKLFFKDRRNYPRHLVNGSFCKQQDSSSAPDSASLVSNFKKYETCKPTPFLLA